MFKNTYDFFDSVREGNVSQIDIQEFVYKKTKKHKTDRLKTLLSDIEFYLFAEKDFLIAEITPEMWEQKHNHYKEKGEKTPYTEYESLIPKFTETGEIDTTKKRDIIRIYDEENLFFPHDFFCIYQLKNYVTGLIQETSTTNLKHDNIFCNNGFELFEHILNEYVKIQRGRLSDIHFFYWSMYNNKPQYIHQRPERFKEWFFEIYQEDLGKVKIYDTVKNPDRLKHYSNALDWFKLRNN